jgi:hypothetical protein
VAGAEWIDDAGRRARDRLRAGESEAVIGHCDWLAGNLRWSGDELLVVHDWDSLTAGSEAVLVGFAAALYSTVSADELATVEDTERFLVAYCHARGRQFTAGRHRLTQTIDVSRPGVGLTRTRRWRGLGLDSHVVRTLLPVREVDQLGDGSVQCFVNAQP